MTSFKTPIVCVHEDRADYLPGLKLAILSLARHAPRSEVVVSSPGSDAAFERWIGVQPNARLGTFRHIQGSGWNIKPSVLLEMLETHDEVLWIDSDIILTADIGSRLSNLAADVLIATEETYWGQQQGGDFRTLAWGLSRGRLLPATINSGILRVTRRHVRMLRAWQAMLVHPMYLHAQARPWYERPLHMIGDQEALTALLGSEDFADIPIELLRRGADIAQCFGPAGFTPMERIRALFGNGPTFIHAMGPKPWLRGDTPASMWRSGDVVAGWRDWYRYLSLDTSPYCLAARRYAATDAKAATVPGTTALDLRWAWPRSALGKLLTAIGGGSAAASGLPVALIDHVARRARRLLRIARYSQSSEFVLTQRPF